MALHAEFHLFLFITDNLPRMTRPFEVHPIGRDVYMRDLIEFSKLKEESPLFFIPKFLVKNSFFFQKLYRFQARRFWSKVDNSTFVEFFKSREYDNTKMIHIPSFYDYHLQPEGHYAFYPLKGLEKYSTDKFRNLKEPMSYFFKNDGHPNPKGAQLIAKEVLKQMKDLCP